MFPYIYWGLPGLFAEKFRDNGENIEYLANGLYSHRETQRRQFELCFLTELWAMTSYFIYAILGIKFDLLSLNLETNYSIRYIKNINSYNALWECTCVQIPAFVKGQIHLHAEDNRMILFSWEDYYINKDLDKYNSSEHKSN